MTAHIAKPFIHVEDSNGNPYVEANLYVYDVGTTNLKSIYSNTGLSISLTNPLVSDAAGNFARAYLASGSYKLRAETEGGSLIWEIDNIDTGLTSGSGPLAISAGGTSATTAASARTALGAASQTDVDDLSADIATLSASLQNLVSVPQGRLTLTTLTPVISSDVTAGTSVYYTPTIGDQIPIYDNTQFNLETFSELTLSMNANHLAGELYDVFIWLESDVVTIGTGPAWNSAVAGAGSRGSGAGTTQLERISGLFVNANAMTARNGATTYAVGENLATYVGTILIDGSNGQISEHVAVGQNRAPGPKILRVTDATASWAGDNSATPRAANGDSNNRITTLCGIAEEEVACTFRQLLSCAVNGVAAQMDIGIGVNSTSAMSGTRGSYQVGAAASVISGGATAVAGHTVLAGIGINRINALEAATGNSGTETFNGTEAYMLLTADWMS
jgi:hypothetical protein